MPSSTDTDIPEQSARSYQENIETLISAGQPMVAYELVGEAVAHFPENTPLKYLQALALARGGSNRHAEELIKHLLKRADLPSAVRVHTLGLSARIHKDRYTQAIDEKLRLSCARQSAELYLMAFKVSRDPFPGINAATMMLLANGDDALVKSIAAEVLTLAERNLEKTGPDLWLSATMGEACLLLGKTDESEGGNHAEYWYGVAVEQAGEKYGDIASMRRQVHMLQSAIKVPDTILKILHGGTTAVFSGHMIDHPDSTGRGARERFPVDPSLEHRVAAEIKDAITELDIREGFVSAACGSDLLFAEQLLLLGRRVHIVLPFALEDFIHRSVNFGRDDEYWRAWQVRCESVLEQVGNDVHYATTERDNGSDLMFDFANRMLQGLAIQRAQQLSVDAWAIVVEGGENYQAVGGASHFLRNWKSKGEKFARRTHDINLSNLHEETVTESVRKRASTKSNANLLADEAATPSDVAGVSGADEVVLRSMLFADVRGFSLLREDQAKLFFIHFLDKVADLVSKTRHKPVFQNTWGDGLFFVFRQPDDCARFALELVEIANGTDFESLGLPRDLAIRAGIHTGPVFVLPDPIIKRKNVFGSHVNRAARIEPVTVPGCVYASEQMAAIIADCQAEDLLLEYVGVADLAKGYDRCPLYQVAKR